MSPEVVLLILRIAVALALYTFLGALLVLTWRDVRAANRHFTEQHAPAKLVVIFADEEVPLEAGNEYSLQPITTLGRGPTNTIVLPDSFASTGHARITLRGAQWWLEDLDSRNGTKLNGVPIGGAVVISSKDVIDVGRVKLRFEAG